MNINENERYWQQRAQRAEAECERLRVALQNVWGALQPCPEQGEIAMARSMVSNALATPPPEGEPPTRDKPKWDPKRLSGNRMLRNPEDAARDVSNFDAPHTPEQTECASCGEGMPRDECPESKRPCGHHCNHSWTQDICHWCGKEFGEETDEPQQAHGDALALFDEYVERGHLFWNTYKRQDAIAKIRQALTASGVPEEELRKQNEALRRRIRGMGEYTKEIEEKVRRALELAEDALSRQSWQWTGAGPHPQTVIEAVRSALASAPAESGDSDIRTDHGIPS